MKKTLTRKGMQRKPRSELKWQTGDYDRRAEFKFVLPYQFLLLCRLVDKTPEDIIRDFADNLSCGNGSGRERLGEEHLINYFIAHGYGQHHYSEEDIRQMFKEMDALGSLFPTNGINQAVSNLSRLDTLYEEGTIAQKPQIIGSIYPEKLVLTDFNIEPSG